MTWNGSLLCYALSMDASSPNAASPTQILQDLWTGAGGDPAALAAVTLTGEEPALPSSFRVGAQAQATIAAAGLAAAEIHKRRGGPSQGVAVDMRHAAIEFRSERYMRLAQAPPGPTWDKIAGVYTTGDGRYVRLHTNFPHHREGMLKLLACAYEREAVQAALSKLEGEKFETAAAEAGLVATMFRSPAQWADHPQGRAVAELPLLEIARIGEAPARPLPAAGERPLSGIRVLDLDTGRGKLSAALDLRAAEERERLAGLLREAHIFVQGYRPGAIAGHGFSPEACAEIRPGIVAVSLSAYGRAGPWANRRGFDSLVQNASGINHAEAEAAGALPRPKELPAQALDHATGYLMAFGAMMALARKAREGGSWHVRVSLAQTGRWLGQLGRLEDGFACADPKLADVTDLLDATDTSFGRMTYVRHAARLSATPARWERPPVALGTHAPVWPV